MEHGGRRRYETVVFVRNGNGKERDCYEINDTLINYFTRILVSSYLASLARIAHHQPVSCFFCETKARRVESTLLFLKTKVVKS